jgi:hypothetical protein
VYGVDAGMRVTTNHVTHPRTYHGTSQLACEKFWKLFSTSSGKPVACLRFDDFRGTGANLESHTYSGTERGRSSGSGGESEGEAFLAEASRTVVQTVSCARNDIVNVYCGVTKSARDSAL